MTPSLTLNLGLRYDLVDRRVRQLGGVPAVHRGRPPERHEQLRVRALGFAYQPDRQDGHPRRLRQVLRRRHGSAGGVHAAQRAADHAADPERRTAGLRVEPVQRSGADLRPGVTAPVLGESGRRLPAAERWQFRRERSECPISHQASIGVQRQLGEVMAVEADWVYTAERGTWSRATSTSRYNPATGANYPFTDVTRRPYSAWGNTEPEPPGQRVELPRAAGGVHEADARPLAGVGDLHARRAVESRSATAQSGLRAPDDVHRHGFSDVRRADHAGAGHLRERLVPVG